MGEIETQTDRLTRRDTERQTERQRHRETETDRDRDVEIYRQTKAQRQRLRAADSDATRRARHLQTTEGSSASTHSPQGDVAWHTTGLSSRLLVAVWFGLQCMLGLDVRWADNRAA